MLEAQERQRDELAALSSRTLDAQEEERRRIARELHDETAQELTALLLRIRLAANGSREPATRERLAELRVATARTLDGVRRLARELRPTILDDLGLVEAVRACAQDVATREGLQVDVRAHGLDGRLHPTRELVLYRVVQEALSNVAKHADARNVRVTLDRAGAMSWRPWSTTGAASTWRPRSTSRRPAAASACSGCASGWRWSAATWRSTRRSISGRASAPGCP